MTDNDSQRIVAEEYAATNPKPSLFWADLADDLRDPAFRKAYEAGWRKALRARDTAYADDRCACTSCLIEHMQEGRP